MPEGQLHSSLSVAQPIACRIRVQGRIVPSWLDRFEGLVISTTSKPGERTVTTLQGVLPDQAALVGVINSLNDLRLPMLSVECLDSVPAGETDAPASASRENA